MAKTKTRKQHSTDLQELPKLDELQQYTTKTNQHAEHTATILAMERYYLRRKQRLAKFKEPVMFLERTDGKIELYENVKDKVFIVPRLKAGIEKRIILGRQWQSDIPWAGKTFKAYWCHEDWAYPHKWSKPQYYQGPTEEAPIQTTENKTPRHGWILEAANINSENMRDRERKMLIAWEKFNAEAGSMNIIAWAKAIAIVGGIIIAGIWVYNSFFGGQPQAAAPVVKAATNATTVIIG